MLIKSHYSQKERTRCLSLFMWDSEWSKLSWVCPVPPSRAIHGPRVMHTAFLHRVRHTGVCVGGDGFALTNGAGVSADAVGGKNVLALVILESYV